MDTPALLCSLFILIINLYFPNFTFAETILLKSGKTIHEKIIEKTDRYIKIKVSGSSFPIFIEEIERIDGQKMPSSVEKISPEVDATVIYSKDFDPKEFGKYRGTVEARLCGLEAERSMRQGLTDEAIESFKKALVLDPQCIGAYLGLGRCYTLERKPNKALEIYGKAIKVAPKYSPMFYDLMASSYVQVKNYKKAKHYCELSLGLVPADEKAYLILGAVYYNLGDIQKAKDSYKNALDISIKEGKKKIAQQAENSLKKLP